MAPTKRKRKHRGNAAGIVERPAHNSRGASAGSSGAKKGPMTKEQTRLEAQRRRQERLSRPPPGARAPPPAGEGPPPGRGPPRGLFPNLVHVFFKGKGNPDHPPRVVFPPA